MEMEEMMMMMMISRSVEKLRIESISNDPITTSTSPTWKLYENPFYTDTNTTTPHKQHPKNQNHQKQLLQQINSQENNSTDQLMQIHRLQLPISARKIQASFWDLTFIKPLMESELDMARAKITQLKAQLEQERRMRKKAESMNKKIARELSEVRKGREALERLCQDLAKEVSSEKAEIHRMYQDMEEERKMLRMAEVLREERVQMKLAEAKHLLEEKLSELEASRSTSTSTSSTKQMLLQTDRSSSCSNNPPAQTSQEGDHIINSRSNYKTVSNGVVNNQYSSSGEDIIKLCVLVDQNKSTSNIYHLSAPASQRRASPETENPHIRRGIRGFVEFPKVVRAIGSKSRHLGTKLECQKAQLRILLKQKSPIRSNSLITS